MRELFGFVDTVSGRSYCAPANNSELLVED